MNRNPEITPHGTRLQSRVEKMTGPRREYAIGDIKHLDRAVHFFGDHVAFDKEAWLRDGR